MPIPLFRCKSAFAATPRSVNPFHAWLKANIPFPRSDLQQQTTRFSRDFPSGGVVNYVIHGVSLQENTTNTYFTTSPVGRGRELRN
jgi:hypothetical protein